MQIDELVRAYQNKTDEELLQLVEFPEQLTPEANVVLAGELAKRRIQPKPARDEDAPQSADAPPCSLDLPVRDIPLHKFLADVFTIYSDHFWLFFKMAVPALIASWSLNAWRLRQTSVLSRRFAQHLGTPGMWPVIATTIRFFRTAKETRTFMPCIGKGVVLCVM